MIKKLKCSPFSIVFLLLSIFKTNGIKDINENNIENYLARDCNKIADFIEDNFSTFVSKYNETSVEKWLASSIENKKLVINVTNNTKAVYLDFNDNNGYAVVGNDYNFLDFSKTGDLAYLKNVDIILFSEYDGFVYETEDGYARYDYIYQVETYYDDVSYKEVYMGQRSEGAGQIVLPDSYIVSRYGSGYQLETIKRLNGYKNVVQNKYTIYIKNGVGEGNCTLSAMYGIMQYLRDNKRMTKLPSDEVTIDPKTDSFYDRLTQDGYISQKTTLPHIYETIRRKSIDYGYTNESTAWTSINMVNIYHDVMAAFEYSSGFFKRYAKVVLNFSFESQVKRQIDAGLPIMFNTARGQYGSHSMVVNGYRRYSKEHKFWFIKWTEYKNLLSLNDNWQKLDICFDLDAYKTNIFKEGFGTFMQVTS